MSNLKKVTFQQNSLRNLGFTLLELMVVTALLAVLAAASIPTMHRKGEELQASKANAEIQQVLVQARQHRIATGAWPANTAVLIAANRLPASAANSVYGTPYVFTITAGNNLQLSVNTNEVSKATRLAGSDLPFVARVGTTVSTQVTPAGLEAANSQFYLLDGTRPLAGNMNANGNNINNANQINATGNITTSGNIQGRRVTATDLMLSQNGFASLSNPAYVLRPDGGSNIRNLTAEQIRATYLESSGSIVANSTITAGGNITTSSNFIGRSANLSQNLSALGTITGGNIISNGNVNGVDLIASNSVQAPELRATIKFSAPRFESSVNTSYHLTPHGVSNLYDLTARNGQFTYLSVTGNTDIGGNANVTGNIVGSNITANNTMYARNGFASRDNPSFIVIPDGTSNINNLSANNVTVRGQLVAQQNASVFGDIVGGRDMLLNRDGTIGGRLSVNGNISSGGDITGRRFLDSDNAATYVDPSSTSQLTNLSTRTLRVTDSVSEGAGCVGSSIGLTSAGKLVSCISGSWTAPGDNKFGGSYLVTRRTTGGQPTVCYLGFCSPNPLTGGYSCPSGYTPVGGLTGMSYRDDPWDLRHEYFVCVKP